MIVRYAGPLPGFMAIAFSGRRRCRRQYPAIPMRKVHLRAEAHMFEGTNGHLLIHDRFPRGKCSRGYPSSAASNIPSALQAITTLLKAVAVQGVYQPPRMAPRGGGGITAAYLFRYSWRLCRSADLSVMRRTFPIPSQSRSTRAQYYRHAWRRLSGVSRGIGSACRGDLPGQSLERRDDSWVVSGLSVFSLVSALPINELALSGRYRR